MSNTRHASPNSSFRQEKYASSSEFELGLNAVLVAKRCSILTDATEIELIWFLQYLSHQAGSLKRIAEQLLESASDRLGTATMHEIGVPQGKPYAAHEVTIVRERDEDLFSHNEFLLKGEKERSFSDFLPARLIDNRRDEQSMEEHQSRLRAQRLSEAHEKAERDRHPTSYPVSAFLETCRARFLKEVPQLLRDLCLNPALSPSGVSVPYFQDFYGALREFASNHAKERLSGLVITEIGKRVLGTLDYAEQQKSLVLIQGNARTGKSFVTQAWCEALPGRRRYVQAPSSNDLKDFFRAVAKALGMSASYNLKAQDLRARIGDVLQGAYLTLVIDEAHYMFPQTNFREALPNRINWLLTELVNAGVPVALVSTPQFTISQKIIEKNTHWASEQLMGRISRYTALPERLEKRDLAAVARYHLPEGDERSIAALVAYAQASKKYLAGIEHATKAARFESKLQGRAKVTFNDIREAIGNSVMPSDLALQQALSPAPKTARKRSSNPAATPLHSPFTPPSPVPPRHEDDSLSVLPSSAPYARELSQPLIID
jgi:hypothetical protein